MTRSKTVRADQGARPTNRPREVRRSASRPGLTGRHQAGEGRGRLAPRWLVLHVGLYLVMNGFFTVTWLLAPDVPGVDEQFWPAWIMLLLATKAGDQLAGQLVVGVQQLAPAAVAHLPGPLGRPDDVGEQHGGQCPPGPGWLLDGWSP